MAQDTKAAQEVAALQAFHAMLGQDSARAFYGPGHVRAAHELGAVQTLLISDTLFRVNDVAKVSPSRSSLVAWRLQELRLHPHHALDGTQALADLCLSPVSGLYPVLP